MKLLQLDNGGRPFANDDILTLQTQVYDAVEATLVGAAAMVLSGCQVTITSPNVGNIAAGYLWLAGEILRYPGANQVALPAEVIAGPADESDYRAYQTGGSKACMSELTCLTQADGTAPAGTERVRFLSAATRTYSKWVESKCRQVGDLQDSVGPTLGLCDADGLGYADGPRAGWGLANGKGGRANLMERFRVGLNPDAVDYSEPGKTGGAATVSLTAAQNGPHQHSSTKWKQAIQYDRGSTGGSPDWGAGQLADNTGSSGQGQAHENRPPYYTVAVWQWVGLG